MAFTGDPSQITDPASGAASAGVVNADQFSAIVGLSGPGAPGFAGNGGQGGNNANSAGQPTATDVSRAPAGLPGTKGRFTTASTDDADVSPGKPGRGGPTLSIISMDDIHIGTGVTLDISGSDGGNATAAGGVSGGAAVGNGASGSPGGGLFVESLRDFINDGTIKLNGGKGGAGTLDRDIGGTFWAGGAAGASAGVIDILALHRVINNVIQLIGGAGADAIARNTSGDGDGGGGGDGGSARIRWGKLYTAGTITLTKGLGGAAVNSGSAGTAGVDGVVDALQIAS